MATTYSVSPTNFRTVTQQCAECLDIEVGKPGLFSNGITIRVAKRPSGLFQLFVQIGLTLPTGHVEDFALHYACSGKSSIIQLNLIQVIGPDGTTVIWETQAPQTGSGVYSPHLDRPIPFTGSLDFTVGLGFADLKDTIQIGALTFTVD
jgi:hypothetical protein